MQDGLTPNQQAVLDLQAQGYTRQQIADRLGVSVNSVKKRLERARKRLSKQQAIAADTVGIPYDQLHSGWFKTEEASLYFKVPQEQQGFAEYVESIKEALQGAVGTSERVSRPHSKKDILTRYILADLHFGMMSWGEQTGEDYDLKIAEQRLLDSVVELLESTPDAEHALILNVGDTFHANDSKNETPGSGHLLDVDGRFPKIALATTRAIRRCIDFALLKHEKVEYVGIQGNHDPDQSHWLNIALMMHYENNDRVTVHWNPSEFFAMQWGRNLITAHHGDKATFEKLAMYIADRYAEQWGRTFWRFCDTGHIHHHQSRDVGGIKFRSYRTIASKDAYAAAHGYSARQTLSAITVHRERGEILESHVNVY